MSIVYNTVCIHNFPPRNLQETLFLSLRRRPAPTSGSIPDASLKKLPAAVPGEDHPRPVRPSGLA